MEEDIPALECDVCEGIDFYKDAGHYYCNICQTQSQEITEQLFSQEAATINKKSTRKIRKEKSRNAEKKLTSWECHNVILKGLTEELIGLGAKKKLKVVVRCLWMKYLEKCEVFDLKTNTPPKVSIIGSKKDIAILYNVKKRKRKRSESLPTSTPKSIRRWRSKKKRALVQKEYEELTQSQSLTQDLAGETLSSLKNPADMSDGSEKIGYNRYSNKQLKGLMSKKHQEAHESDVNGEMSCHKFGTKSFSSSFVRGPSVLTSFTLYSILYIGLLIVEDTLQLSDVLRFIREGHLSFYSYRHFFPEDMSDKRLNLPGRNDKLYSNEYFRKRTAKLVHFLKVRKYIKKPNLAALCSRYCAELNLPKEVFECVKKLIVRTAPQMPFGKETMELPNYEGRAMSFIVFTLKLFFGLDGVTENKFSDFATTLNNAEIDPKMFNFREWLKYIEYRATVIATYHMPTSLQRTDNVDSDMYLDYLKNQEISFKNTGKHIQNEVSDFLQVLEKLLDSDDVNQGDELKFDPSVTPFVSYSKVILDSKEIGCENVLKQSFSGDSLEFLSRPNEYLKLLGTTSVKNGGANDNIVIEDMLHLYKATCVRKKYHNPVAVQVSDEVKDDGCIQEFLDQDKKDSLTTTDVNVFLSNWQIGNEKQFLKNRTRLKLASENVKVTTKKDVSPETYPEHYNTFERYWLNIPANPTVVRYFSKSRTEELTSKLCHAFKIMLKDCTRIIEQDTYDFYSEFLVTELNLVYFKKYRSKIKETKERPEIEKLLKDCLKSW